ncbi:MAG: hypothetical protein GXC73_16880, partial [Chitinophagaceae bacterium]|nr:hypothetical protein [Chitinophagaceae bacterium]
MTVQKGDIFKLTFAVTYEVYNGFVTTFNDRNPLHCNEVFAVERGFQGKVMHGNILNGFLSYFVGEGLPDKNVIIHSQSIQFKRPVYLEDVLSFEAVVHDVYESVRVVEFSFVFRNSLLLVVAK